MTTINDLGNFLSQRDPQWANNKIGNSQITIGQMGCALTCLSEASKFFGCYLSPAEIASHNDWFDDQGSLNWTKINFPTMSFRYRSYDKDMDMIKAYLSHSNNSESDKNKFVMIQVKCHNALHWLSGLWMTADGGLNAIDPWYGQACNLLERYPEIVGFALLVRWDKTKTSGHEAWQTGQGMPVAPNYN